MRVAATSNHAAVDPLAFIGPAGKRVVVIKADSAARVQIQGMPPARYSSSFTTADEADVQQPVRTMNGVLQVAIPAAGVLTVFAD